MIPVYKPYIPFQSVEYATDAIKSTWISSIGKYVDLASERLAKIGGYEYVILANNGTSATHLVTKSLKKFHPQIKRVLVPSACYVAVYNSLMYDNNQWDIQCVDLDPETWNMTIEHVGPEDAVFAVHNLGNIINIPRLKEKHGCVVIEDNCEGFFGTHDNSFAGSKSLCSSLSFFGNKNITCGEGGAFMTNDKDIYDFVMKIRGQGQSEERYIHDELGYNYRMTNVQAAILLGQLENLEYIFENKKRVFERYKNNLKSLHDVQVQKEEEGTTHSMWMFGVRFRNLSDYKTAREYFNKFKIDTRPMFYSYKKHAHLSLSGEDKNAENINKQVVVFPSYPELLNEEVDYICDKIIEFSNKLKTRK